MKHLRIAFTCLALGLTAAIPAQASERVSVWVGAPAVMVHYDDEHAERFHPAQRHVYGRPYRHNARHHHHGARDHWARHSFHDRHHRHHRRGCKHDD